MFWADRTPRERMLAVIAVVMLMMGACSKAFGEDAAEKEPMGTCAARDDLRSWSDGLIGLVKPGMKRAEVAKIDEYRMRSRKIENQLTVLCAQEEAGSATLDIQWIRQADGVNQAILELSVQQAQEEFHVLYDLLWTTVRLNLYLNLRREQIYHEMLVECA
jgi:hypothetical protein